MPINASEESQNFARTLEDLLDEAEMADGDLSREKVDNLYLRRSIEPDEALRLEKILRERGIVINEGPELLNTEVNIEDDYSGTYATAIDHLIATARRVRLLTPDDEAAHGETVQRASQILAKPDADRTVLENRAIVAGRKSYNALVHHNIRLVTSFVSDRRYRYRHDIDDMVQMGLFGLMRAAEKFDPSHGCRFSTYAMWWIRQGVHRGIANDGNTIRLPVHMIALIGKFKRTQRRLSLTQGSSERAVLRIAESLGWSEVFTARISQLAEMKTVSFETPLTAEADMTIGDLIPDLLPGPEELLVESDTSTHLRGILNDLTDERHRDIIKRRFGLDGPEETLEEIGQRYGVTRERIRQIEAVALKKLRHRALHSRLKWMGPMK